MLEFKQNKLGIRAELVIDDIRSCVCLIELVNGIYYPQFQTAWLGSSELRQIADKLDELNKPEHV